MTERGPYRRREHGPIVPLVVITRFGLTIHCLECDRGLWADKRGYWRHYVRVWSGKRAA